MCTADAAARKWLRKGATLGERRRRDLVGGDEDARMLLRLKSNNVRVGELERVVGRDDGQTLLSIEREATMGSPFMPTAAEEASLRQLIRPSLMRSLAQLRLMKAVLTVDGREQWWR